MSRLSVLHVVSELYPYAKTGGLGDVAAALPPALRSAGVDARIVVPGYPGVLEAIRKAHTVHEDDDLFGGGAARVLAATLRGTDVPAFVLDCPGLFRRDGGPYQDASGKDFPDNASRFAALGWTAHELSTQGMGGFHPDVLHAHDWQGGLAIAYTKLRGGLGPACVVTIHNVAYPGAFDPKLLPELALPPECYSIFGVEFFGRISFLKAGLYYADRITTVSPTYARELLHDGQGGGFEGLLRGRSRDLSGILNGVDYREWSPDVDPHLPAPYDLEHLARKGESKTALKRRLGLDEAHHGPVFGMVSRLVHQKGVDWVLEVLPSLVQRGGMAVFLGSGDEAIASGLERIARAFPRRVAFQRGYDESLSHLIQAGSDFILVPSRSEPCGLTQLYALRYGSIPIVRRTGGLADTVVDATPEAMRAGRATGFSFDSESAAGLESAVDRALAIHRRPDLREGLQRAGMRADFSWNGPAMAYRALYESARRGRGR
ncbi:MAG TPA: glycogen synthase GlgA [Polyangiaceae bacterium]|nr:glycogen synthase GlgA [Polyangiaceae bacterium]